MWRYSVRRITDGACISIRCECSMCPLCSSIRATPLKIITTARRSVHTLIGSKEAFSTRTRAFMVRLILREPAGGCQNWELKLLARFVTLERFRAEETTIREGKGGLLVPGPPP